MPQNRPVFEGLEPRLLLSGTSYLVNSLGDVVADDGVVALREEIEAADTNLTVTADALADTQVQAMPAGAARPNAAGVDTQQMLPVPGELLNSQVIGTLTAWGWNGDGQTNVPSGSDFVAVAAGRRHSLAVRSDGTLAAWGDNDYGQTSVPSGSDFAAVSAGYWHSLALRSDGTLAAWGDNDLGQTNVPSGSDFVAVAAGRVHSLALRSDGCPSRKLHPSKRRRESGRNREIGICSRYVALHKIKIRRTRFSVWTDVQIAVAGHDWLQNQTPIVGAGHVAFFDTGPATRTSKVAQIGCSYRFIITLRGR